MKSRATNEDALSADKVPVDICARGLGKKFGIYMNDRDRVFELFSRKVRHQEFWALRDLNFDIVRGSANGIIGSNGAGKSTLLKLLAGVSAPTEGELKVNATISSLLDLGLGFHENFSGRQNIYLNCTLQGLARVEIDEILPDIVSFAELEGFIDYPVKTYSSGMSLRLGFAISAHLKYEIFLIDEVLTVGDQYFQRKCVRKIEEFISQGRTIVLVSHDLHAIRSLCDRVMWLKDGRIVQDGPAPHVVDAFLDALRARESGARVIRPLPLTPLRRPPSEEAPTNKREEEESSDERARSLTRIARTGEFATTPGNSADDAHPSENFDGEESAGNPEEQGTPGSSEEQETIEGLEEHGMHESSEEQETIEGLEEHGMHESSEEQETIDSPEEQGMHESSEEQETIDSPEEQGMHESSEGQELTQGPDDARTTGNSEEMEFAEGRDEQETVLTSERREIAESFEKPGTVGSSEEPENAARSQEQGSVGSSRRELGIAESTTSDADSSGDVPNAGQTRVEDLEMVDSETDMEPHRAAAASRYHHSTKHRHHSERLKKLHYRSTDPDPGLKKMTLRATTFDSPEEFWNENDSVEAHQEYHGNLPLITGSGEARILEILVLGSEGESREEFTTCESVTIAVTVKAIEPIEDPIFGVAIHRNDDVYVYGPNSAFDRCLKGTYHGLYTFFLHYPSLPLLAGSYLLSVALWDKHHLKPYVWHNRLYSIRFKADREDHGLVVIPHEWGVITHVAGSREEISAEEEVDKSKTRG